MYKFLLFFFTLLLFSKRIYAQSNESLANSLYDEVSHIVDRPARPNLEKAIDLCRNGQCADTTLARFYRRLGAVFFNGYISDELAIAYTDTSILLYERALGRENFYTAESYFNKGTFQKILEDFGSARKNVELAITILDRIELPKKIDADSVKYTWNKNLGEIFRRKGDLFMASSVYNKLLKIPGITRQQKIRALNSIGLLESDRGNYQNSVMALREAIALESIDYINKARCTGNLGLTYLSLNNYFLAKKYLTKCLAYQEDILKNHADKIPSRIKFKEIRSNSHVNLLQLYIQTQEYDKAEYHYSEALNLGCSVC